MRRRGPEEEEACGVWLDAAALKRRKVQVGRWGTRGCWGKAWRSGGVRREFRGPEGNEGKVGDRESNSFGNSEARGSGA